MYPKVTQAVPCQILAFIFFQNTYNHYWFQWELPLYSASEFGRNGKEGDKEVPSSLDGGGWVSGTWLRRLFANMPFGTTIPMITECEDLIIFKSDERVQLFCRPVWGTWEHGIDPNSYMATWSARSWVPSFPYASEAQDTSWKCLCAFFLGLLGLEQVNI